MDDIKYTYILPPEMYEDLKKAYMSELLKLEWDGTEIIDGIRFAKSEPAHENRAMRRKNKRPQSVHR